MENFHVSKEGGMQCHNSRATSDRRRNERFLHSSTLTLGTNGAAQPPGIDAVGLQKIFQSKQAPPTIPALQWNRACLIYSGKHISPFVADPILKWKRKASFWTSGDGLRDFRNRFKQQAFTCRKP